MLNTKKLKHSFNLVIEILIIDRKQISRALPTSLVCFNLVIEILIIDRRFPQLPRRLRLRRFNLVIEILIIDRFYMVEFAPYSGNVSIS